MSAIIGAAVQFGDGSHVAAMRRCIIQVSLLGSLLARVMLNLSASAKRFTLFLIHKATISVTTDTVKVIVSSAPAIATPRGAHVTTGMR